MTTPCLYSIIRYVPYAETKKLANIVVVFCTPKKHAFHFKLMQGNDARICAFLRDDTIFPYAKNAVARELKLSKEKIRNFNSAKGL